MSSPEAPHSEIERVQHTRALVDAIVQAGLASRMAYSLVGGMAGAVKAVGVEDAANLIDEARQQAEQVKNADMALDHPIATENRGADELREAANALEQAANAYRVAAKMQDAVTASITSPSENSE